MKIISKISKNTYTSTKTKEVKNYINYFLIADNGKSIQIRCAFADDYDKLAMICNVEGIELQKRQSKLTYKNKSGTESHYYNYFVGLNNRFIQIKCAYMVDYSKLDMLAVYVG